MTKIQHRIAVMSIAACMCVTAFAAQPHRIHCVTDISHEFTFYFDGRFGKNYVSPNGTDARNWGTLHKYDFTNVNLLILQSSASPCPYPPEDIEAVRKLITEGGAVVALGDFSLFRDEKQYRLNALTEPFGAVFINDPAQKPLKGYEILENEKIESYSPKTIKLTNASNWDILVTDARDRVIMAQRRLGKGYLIVASRSLCGHNPNASDPINDTWWKPLLQQITANKPVDPKRRPPNQMPENTTNRQRLPIQYSDYMKSWADAIYAVYDECFPVIEQVMGVPPSEGMLTNLILLPTGGGGFSSGSSIGLAAWWGGFPEKKYGMVELISHESTHSWVHPFTEPMWNEGLATYVGILVGRKMDLAADADSTLDGWIKGAKGHDPDMTKYDLAQGKDIPHVVAMAKPMWIFKQLRKEKPDIVARYFQTKRKLATRDKIDKYTPDESVAVLSIAMGRSLFPWFQSLGIAVDPDNAKIKLESAQPARANTSAAPDSSSPVSIIFDTDLDSDVDDVGALAVLHALANRGQAKILGVIVTSDDMHSPLCADAINTYFKRPDIPIGVEKNEKLRSFSRYTKTIAQEYPHDLKSYADADDATSLYRKILASQPDNSVVITTVGHLTNLKNLLLSKPDTHSPLNGTALVAAKVRLWSCMGGKYPQGREPNFYRPDPASTELCVSRWPTKAVFSGAEIGNPVITGAQRLKQQAPAESPVRRAYEVYNQFKGRSSWDQTAVLYAVTGNADRWTIHTDGCNTAAADGSNQWRPSPDKPHAYLIEKLPPQQLAAEIENLMIQPPTN